MNSTDNNMIPNGLTIFYVRYCYLKSWHRPIIHVKTRVSVSPFLFILFLLRAVWVRVTFFSRIIIFITILVVVSLLNACNFDLVNISVFFILEVRLFFLSYWFCLLVFSFSSVFFALFLLTIVPLINLIFRHFKSRYFISSTWIWSNAVDLYAIFLDIVDHKVTRV